jgi:outer membrane protein assembly factor BamB
MSNALAHHAAKFALFAVVAVGWGAPLGAQWSEAGSAFQVRFQVKLADPGFMTYLPEETAGTATDPARRRVYVGGQGGVLRCLDGDDGHELWAFDSRGEIRVTPLLHGGLVLFGDMNGNVRALDRDTGSVVWEARLEDAISGTLAVAGDTLLVSDARGSINALALAGGARKWKVRREGSQRFLIRSVGHFVVSGEVVVKGFPDGKLAFLSLASGDKLRESDLAGGAKEFPDVDSGPLLVPGGLVVAGSYSAGLFGVDLATGDRRWRLEGTAYALPTLHEGRLYAIHGGTELVELDPASGKVLRSMVLGERSVRDLGSAGGHLWAADGKSLARVDLGAPAASLRIPFLFGVSSVPAVAGSTLYILSDSGYIYAVEPLPAAR